MTRPADDLAEAISRGSTGLKAWQQANGCEAKCWCSVCMPLNVGLEQLNEALREMGRAG